MITKEALSKVHGVHTGKMILFDFIDLNKIFTWNEIDEFIRQTNASVLYHNGNCGHSILKEFGLTGYWISVPVENLPS